MNDDYRHRKELFVSNLSGTTLYETGSIVINICASYFLCQIVKCSIPKIQSFSFWNFLWEYSILVIPMILVSTYCSSISTIFHGILWTMAFVLYLIKSNVRMKTPSVVDKTRFYSRILENFRGQILIVTCICILAVDFPAFPRRYAKTENYGYSGMDLGVGLFALAHGMVSSEARSKSSKFIELILENAVLLILGLIRLIAIKYFSYAEHVSEYGIHWNFFLTLCSMKLIGNSLLNLTKNLPILIGVSLIVHEWLLLRYFQFEDYLINSDPIRKNFFDANREGICSLGGYVCLYLIGIYIGRLVIAGEREQRLKEMSIGFTVATIVLCAISFNPSRKLCNFSYISSTTGLACMCMAGFSFIQWLLLRKNVSIQSMLLENINRKALDIFLLANVLTGIINLNVDTIDTSDGRALVIILIYMFIVTIVVYFFPSIIKLLMSLFKKSKN